MTFTLRQAAWAKGIDLNLNAHFQLIHKFMPVFLEQQKGNIIHFTTIAGTVGLGMGPQRHAYAAGKSGAATLTKRIGIEHSKQVRQMHSRRRFLPYLSPPHHATSTLRSCAVSTEAPSVSTICIYFTGSPPSA